MSYRSPCYLAGAAARPFGPRAAILILLAAAAIAGCGGRSTLWNGAATAPLSSSNVTISPTVAMVGVGNRSFAFAASIGGSNSGVTWEVNGIPGGNSTIGTISPAGVYSSPAVMPSPGNVTITAVSLADTSEIGSATVTLTAGAENATVMISPSNVTVLKGSGTQQFSATLTSATNGSIIWQVNGDTGGNSVVGTITESGLYIAPAVPPAQPTVTIGAVLASDHTRYGLASATIVANLPISMISGVPVTMVTAGWPYDF